MELNHLRYFYEVARLQSFSRASRTLRVSQPSISKIVQKLEYGMGVSLLERHRRGVNLTSQGKLVYARCAKIFDEVEGIKQTQRSPRGECTGDLRIAASDNICNYVLPGLLNYFWKSHPLVRVHLTSSTAEFIQREVVDARSEFGIFYTPPTSPLLDVKVVAKVEFNIVFSPDNERLMALKTFDPKVFSDSYYLGSRSRDYQSPFPVLNLLESIGVEPLRSLEVNTQETQKRMALCEFGYTVLPRFMVEKELRTGELRTIRTPKPLLKSLHLVRRKDTSLSDAAARFLPIFESTIQKAVDRQGARRSLR